MKIHSIYFGGRRWPGEPNAPAHAAAQDPQGVVIPQPIQGEQAFAQQPNPAQQAQVRQELQAAQGGQPPVRLGQRRNAVVELPPMPADAFVQNPEIPQAAHHQQ
jgi:hypothetical protein